MSNVLRRSRAARNQTINLYRGRAALQVLMDQLNGEQCAYRMPALAYAGSPNRDVRNEIARAAEEVAATLVRVVNQLEAILARTQELPWE